MSYAYPRSIVIRRVYKAGGGSSCGGGGVGAS